MTLEHQTDRTLGALDWARHTGRPGDWATVLAELNRLREEVERLEFEAIDRRWSRVEVV
jgi:hypothetical protein